MYYSKNFNVFLSTAFGVKSHIVEEKAIESFCETNRSSQPVSFCRLISFFFPLLDTFPFLYIYFICFHSYLYLIPYWFQLCPFSIPSFIFQKHHLYVMYEHTLALFVISSISNYHLHLLYLMNLYSLEAYGRSLHTILTYQAKLGSRWTANTVYLIKCI